MKDTKEEALPIDSVRRAEVALIEDWGPVTNTTPIQHRLCSTHNSDQCIAHMGKPVRHDSPPEATRPPLLPLQRVAPIALLPLQRVRHTTFHYS